MSKLTRRQILRGAATVGMGAVGAGLLAACQSAPTPAPAAAPKPAEPAAKPNAPASNAELKLQASVVPLGLMAIEFGKRFQQDKGIKVTVEETIYAEIEQKTQTGFISGTLQDVVYGHHRWLFTNFLKGIYLAIDNYLKSSPPENYADIFPSVMASNSLDGKNFSLPDVVHPGGNIAVSYNKNILKEKGLAEPKAGWTFDDWTKLARAAADPKKGIFGMTLEGDNSLHYYSNISRSFGEKAGRDGWLLDEEGKKISFNSAMHKEVGEWYAQLKADKIATRIADLIDKQSVNVFTAGLAATHGGTVNSVATALAKTAGKFDMDAVLLPVGPKGRQGTCYSGNQWMINAKTKYPAESWELLKYLASTEAGVYLVTEGKVQPNGRKSAWADPRVTKVNRMFGIATDLIVAGVEKFPMPNNTRFTEANNAFAAEVDQIWEGGKKWADHAPEVDKKVQAILDLARP
ncbi:MAG: extracellular solute-binding protein [Chloroflexi bacterium]|jgi:ABC-type glycerol-3-phosphate transport system substrate-binding protein|nr:extracellular solute-binding protein [Chloroflexota bacterium]